jgi:hypothetical protein
VGLHRGATYKSTPALAAAQSLEISPPPGIERKLYGGSRDNPSCPSADVIYRPQRKQCPQRKSELLLLLSYGISVPAIAELTSWNERRNCWRESQLTL